MIGVKEFFFFFFFYMRELEYTCIFWRMIQ